MKFWVVQRRVVRRRQLPRGSSRKVHRKVWGFGFFGDKTETEQKQNEERDEQEKVKKSKKTKQKKRRNRANTICSISQLISISANFDFVELSEVELAKVEHPGQEHVTRNFLILALCTCVPTTSWLKTQAQKCLSLFYFFILSFFFYQFSV